ncbi:MAG: hypothetical protein LBV20_02675 [Treponema sp.]|jgi:hypothetical protein|nr:hypothetical protein [Treponema sp.]
MKHKLHTFFLILFTSVFIGVVTAESIPVKNDTGLLWTDPTGSALYESLGFKSGNDTFFAAADIGAVFSDLEVADLSLPFVQVQSGFKTEDVGLTLAGAYASYEDLSLHRGDYQFSSDGAKGGYISEEVFFSIHEITVKQSFLYATAKWNNGDLYYLFGKPEINHVFFPEMSVEYDGKHAITARSLFIDGGLLSNKEDRLGILDIQAWNLEYGFTHKSSGFFLDSALGWFYFNGKAEGALTAANQNYFFFPFNYFNFDGTGNIHIGYAAITAEINPSLFQCKISSGLFQMIYSDIQYSHEYKMKTLFGGSESADAQHLDVLKNVGFVFLNLDLGVNNVPLCQRQGLRFSGGLRKALIIPWNIPGVGDGGITIGDIDTDFIKTILLSGISLYAKISI